MPLESGSRLGVYEVLAPLGAGGMGEVYRARDTRLNRDVAIKILPDTFARDRERVARFTREAQLLASLNHPHIGAIYGFEDTDSIQFLVLELVSGESLAQRLEGGALQADEALRVARQIINALEAAHERGIVHRDLKPANIMLSADGQVKVLDFGLAKVDEYGSASDLTNSPTLSFAATQAGVILGTAAYMSPEQAKARPTDKRTDVWSFGCVLYEILAGRRAFDGEDLSDTLATVLKGEPDWSALPTSTPASIRAILKGCLEKDRKARIPDISVVRYMLDGAVAAPSAATASDAASSRAGRRRVVFWQAASLLFALTAAAGIPAVYVWRSTTPVVTRFSVLPPDKYAFATGGRSGTSVAISPDGRKLAFTVRDATGRSALWIRLLDSLSAQPIAGTDGAAFPFWSPDSRFVAFFTSAKLLKIDVSGGPPQTVCACSGRGGAWNRDGLIVLNDGSGPLVRVPVAGGQPAPVTRLAKGELIHSFPSFLPDGRHVLFSVGAISEATAGVYVTSLDGGEPKQLVAAASGGVYDAGSRHLLFVRDGTLLAQSFDARTLTLAGEPFPVAEQVESAVFLGMNAFSVSDTGTLAYGQGSGANSQLRLTWLDRQGKAIGVVEPDGNYRGVDLSPDGTRVVAHRHDSNGGDVWVTDLSRRTTSRLTFDGSQDNSAPLWSPDGKEILFGSIRAGKWGVYRKPSSGAGSEELLVESDMQILPMAWDPQGRSIVYWVNQGSTSDQWLLPLTGDRQPVALLNTRFREGHPQISPDGKWISYQSDETGRTEVYVRPFPGGAAKWQVSTGGGTFARWRGDGRELFYMTSATGGKVMAADVGSANGVFSAGAPKELFDSGYVNLSSGGNYHTYAVSRDGQRFLIPRPVSSAVEALSSPITVVLNWAAAIK